MSECVGEKGSQGRGAGEYKKKSKERGVSLAGFRLRERWEAGREGGS